MALYWHRIPRDVVVVAVVEANRSFLQTLPGKAQVTDSGCGRFDADMERVKGPGRMLDIERRELGRLHGSVPQMTELVTDLDRKRGTGRMALERAIENIVVAGSV